MNKKIIIPAVVIGVAVIAFIIITDNESSVAKPIITNNDVSNQDTENIAPIKDGFLRNFVVAPVCSQLAPLFW